MGKPSNNQPTDRSQAVDDRDLNDGVAPAGEGSDSKQPAAQPGQTESPVEDGNEAQDLELQLAEQQAKLHEAVLRSQAEMENLRKRLDREMEKARKFALERFMKDLLPVRDSLERGLETASDEAATLEQLAEGKAMTLKLLDKSLEQHGLSILDPEGEAFDPSYHEAMTTQPSDEVAPGVVLKTLQKGFVLNDRVIRPAMVIVSAKA